MVTTMCKATLKKLTVSVEKGENAITNLTSQSSTNAVKYIGNKNSNIPPANLQEPSCIEESGVIQHKG